MSWLGFLRGRGHEQHIACEIVREFRERHAEALATELSTSDMTRATYLNLRREVDGLRTQLRAAELRLMQHGLDMPSSSEG